LHEFKKSNNYHYNNNIAKMGIIEDSYETIIYEDKHRGKVWKEYLENLYDEPELT